MITIEVRNQENQAILGKVDHEKQAQPLKAAGTNLAVLAVKEYTYQPGDKIVVTTEAETAYYMVQLDETLAPTLIYFPDKVWEYELPMTELARKAAVETSFASKRHHLMVRKAYDFEVRTYQNLSVNPHDQKNATGVYPHALANVETRDEAVFFAKNAIDGKYGNLSHGSYPFASWGINQQADAALTIDFGRTVAIDWVRLLFRADYPHDSFWTEITLEFSDGETVTVPTTNAVDFQEVRFPMKETTILTFKALKKAEDESPFPALTQIEAFGVNIV